MNTSVVAGQLVRPGDVTVADADGVLAMPEPAAATVLAAAAERFSNESKRKTLEQGMLGVDLYDLRPLLSSLGVQYVDGLPGSEA